NEFYKKYFNKYLNFHRVCAFVKSEINEKGKITKTYPFCNYMTPYDKLKTIPDFKTYLNN
ncbi:MAG: integrase, partial [Candidatus Pacebacteria bacterium]|nr:integrase [Candidatus Paceibacterota bacterium]